MKLLTASLLFCGGATVAFSQFPPFQFIQEPGPHPVGLKVVNQYDSSRQFPLAADRKGRPLQTLIWYPATRSRSKPMTAADYVALEDTEIHFDKADQEHNKWRKRLNSSFDGSLWAVRDAKPEDGHYPVLIYAPSDSSVAWENADLCEYLASHGYVVLASPSMGASTRDMTDDVEGINEQARDISFLITYAGTLPDTDISRVAAVSFSWGGISSLFAAARDPRIGALAEMDGSMRYYPGLVKQAGDVHPEKVKIPLLFFTANTTDYIESIQRFHGPPGDVVGPSVLNAWKHGDLFTVNMLGMSHPEFCSMYERMKTAQTFAEDVVADFGRPDANTGYAKAALYTLKFLDAYLKKDASAKAFLARTPTDNGIPKHFMGISARFAASDPFEDAMTAAAEQGHQQTVEAYREFANDPSHRDAGDLEKRMNALGYTLMGGHEIEAAVRVFQVNAEAHNESANVFDSLGDGYSAVGDKANAIKAYQRSVELNPANEHAKGEIKKLQSR